MFRPLRAFLCLLPMLATSALCWPATQASEVNRNCAQCHGADGNARDEKGNWLIGPSIAGQVPEYITEQLQNFAQVTDNNKVVLDDKGKPIYKRYAVYMSPLANVLDKDSMANFGNMYHGYKAKVFPIAKNNPKMIEMGEIIWRVGLPESKVPACAACHGVIGQGIPKLFPRLGGQNPEYLAGQLMKFRTGKRPGGLSDMMKTIALRLTDDEISAVSLYASGLDFNPESDFTR